MMNFVIVGDITQKGYDKKRNKLLAPYMQQNKAEQVIIKKVAAAPETETPPTSEPKPKSPEVNKIDLKTPSFIPVEDSGPGPSNSNSNGHFEPDSLDPNINNEADNNGSNHEAEPKSESSAASASISASTSNNGAASKKPRSR